MSNNATPTQTPTPIQALELLNNLAKHPDLRLNLAEHSNVQLALHVLKAVVQPVQPEAVCEAG